MVKNFTPINERLKTRGAKNAYKLARTKERRPTNKNQVAGEMERNILKNT
jgi:hypothetical protein